MQTGIWIRASGFDRCRTPNRESRIPAAKIPMPGIIGKVSFDPQEILARAVLDRMLDVSSRPGSEMRAVFTAPGIALGGCGVRDRRLPSPVGGFIGTSDA